MENKIYISKTFKSENVESAAKVMMLAFFYKKIEHWIAYRYSIRSFTTDEVMPIYGVTKFQPDFAINNRFINFPKDYTLIGSLPDYGYNYDLSDLRLLLISKYREEVELGSIIIYNTFIKIYHEYKHKCSRIYN